MKLRSIVHAAVVIALAACGKPASAPGPTGPSNTATANVPTGPVTEANLIAFFRGAFPDAVSSGTITLDFGTGSVGPQVIEELSIMGITDMQAVAGLVPSDFATRGIGAIRASSAPTTTIAGLLRDLMVIRDANRYFTQAWRHSFSTSGPEDFPAPVAYGVDFEKVRALGVFEQSDGGGDDGGNPCDGGGGDDDDDNPCDY